MINSDLHIHSYYSGDSETPTEEMIRRGIELGLKTMCFTEHFDMDFPANLGDFSLDTPAYFKELSALRAIYKDRIEILFGAELGLLNGLGKRYEAYAASFPFDYLIASQHLLYNDDPYYASFWEGKDAISLIRDYFIEIHSNLLDMKLYDSLGHLDYIVRYSEKAKANYSYKLYADEIDTILRHLIDNGKALEVNSAGLKYGLGFTNPHPDILVRYKELGGELITIGSDGHRPEHLAYAFSEVSHMLQALGYKYHFIYRSHTPEAMAL